MPHKKQDSVNIPVVDVNSADAAQLMLRAAIDYGFIFVKHADLALTPADVEQMFQLSMHFFAAPYELKNVCAINSASSGKNHGWLDMGKETLDPGHQKKGDVKEAFNLGEFVDGKPQQPLPEPLRPHQTELGNFASKCHGLCNKVLNLLAKGLEIPSDEGGEQWFEARHNQSKGPSGSVLRLLYYPKTAPSEAVDPTEDIRAGAHSDYGSVTLLFRLPGQPGLEIKTPENAWAPVPVNPENDSGPLPILVNIGDLLSYWTGGLLKSTVHRVIFPPAGESAADRYSMAYFCHPEDEVRLVEVPSAVVKKHLHTQGDSYSRPKVLTARDHLNSRLAATYGI